jgi:uncharacterized lipoprotein YbaY
MKGGKRAYRPLKRLTYIIRAAWREEKISESINFAVKFDFFQIKRHRIRKYVLKQALSLEGVIIFISHRRYSNIQGRSSGNFAS